MFGADYAAVYDALYADKDYARECELLASLIERYAQTRVHRILDLGCGTGNHAIPLARMGYAVVGVDRSEPMLAQARAKAARASGALAAEFRLGDIRFIELGEQFDCALLMFAVLGYQLADDDVRATLKNVHRHVRPGGLVMFDVWYGPAVSRQRPSDRVKIVAHGGRELRRAASGTLDPQRQVCTVEYQWTGDCRERHQVRYFFPTELELSCGRAGFELLRLGAFPEVDRDPTEETWNVLCVARARE